MRFFQNSDCQRHRPARSGGTHFPDVGFGPLQLGLDDSTASSVRARVTNGTGDALELRELLRARRQRQVKRVQGHHLRPRAIALRYQAVKQCLVSFHRARLSTPRFRETHECRVDSGADADWGTGFAAVMLKVLKLRADKRGIVGVICEHSTGVRLETGLQQCGRPVRSDANSGQHI